MKIQNNTGFSLIEVLVTMLIMSVGLLSIAALQMNAKKATYDSVQRTFASDMVQEMADRMRGNSGELVNYIGKTVGGTGIDLAKVDCTSNCSASEMVSYDLWQWEQAIDGAAELSGATETGGLVTPTACITGDLVTRVYTISIAWRGVGKLVNSSLSDCGNVSGATEDSIYGKSNEYRRIISIDFYISTEGFGV